MYRKPPDVAELSWLGLAAEDYEDDRQFPDIWPENKAAVEVFAAMSTQWFVGMSGPTGLRYESLPIVMRALGVPRADHAVVFAGIQTMERAALAEMRTE